MEKSNNFQEMESFNIKLLVTIFFIVMYVASCSSCCQTLAVSDYKTTDTIRTPVADNYTSIAPQAKKLVARPKQPVVNVKTTVVHASTWLSKLCVTLSFFMMVATTVWLIKEIRKV